MTVEIAKREDVVSVKELQKIEQLQQSTQAELQLKDEAHSTELTALRTELEEMKQRHSDAQQQMRERLTAVEQEKVAQEGNLEQMRTDLEKAREEFAASEQEKTVHENQLKDSCAELEQLAADRYIDERRHRSYAAHTSTAQQLEQEQAKSAQLERSVQELSSSVQHIGTGCTTWSNKCCCCAVESDDDVTAEIVKGPTQEELNTLQARVDELQAELTSTNDAWGVKYEKHVSEHEQIVADANALNSKRHSKSTGRNENCARRGPDKDEADIGSSRSNSDELEQRLETLTKQLQSRRQESSMESAMIEAAEETATISN